MAIPTGTRLGPYEILSAIGAGGMGEVYEARDTQLGRNVAIKVLPAAFANDPERLARFQREAKTLAALNHPNIATIYGLERSNAAMQFLVMELVPGETLADRVKSGPVPVEEALKIAVQIAEALEAAHEKSIIHRDLKPANVKVTPEGKVKVLDFGLAKAFEGDAVESDMNNSPTLSHAATMQGVILGTAAYMSPEQARGKAVDKRTDIWAFGCVLYELLSGKQAFAGEDISDILAAVIRAEPDWRPLPSTTPAKVRDLLRRCLRKDKTQRLQAAGDARIELQESLSAPAEPTNLTPARPGLTRRRTTELGLAAVFVAAVAAGAAWFLKPTPPVSRPVTRTVITLPPGDQLAPTSANPILALSRDGSHLVYAAVHGGVQQLYLRALDSLDARAIPGTEDATNPFFSPDGEWIGFVAGGKVKKVALSGGATVTLGDAAPVRGASWGSHGTIIFAPTAGSVIQEVSDVGGAVKAMTRFDKGESSHRWPEFLPDGKSVLFVTTVPGARAAGQVVGQSSTGERKKLIDGATSPHYVSSGHLLYVEQGTLMAVPFDSQRLEITGKAAPVVESIAGSLTNGAAQFTISDNGSLAYVSGGAQTLADRLAWVSRDGTEQLLTAPAHDYSYPRLSPDGRRLAVTISEQEVQIWIYNLDRDTLTRLTFGGGANLMPAWTPDSKRIAFRANREGGIFWQLADGSGGLERLTPGETTDYPRAFSSDGQLLAHFSTAPDTANDLWVLRLSDRKDLPFLKTQANEAAPAFSPDGHWLAYVSDESGRNEIYVQPYPGPGGKYQISTEGGNEAVWNPKGGELFYRSGNKMMAVVVTTQPSFSIGKPKMLFEGAYLPPILAVPFYDVSPDGQRFLMIKPTEQSSSAAAQIVVVQNWFEELREKVPTGTK